jgi:hypothetical protein
MATQASHEDSAQVLSELRAFIDAEVARCGSTEAINPGHRVKFHWPPHPESYSFHVLASDWSSSIVAKMHGEEFELSIARTRHGVFGRSDSLWLEAHGETDEKMLRRLQQRAEPLFQRQFAIARCLGMEGRFKGHVRDLPPASLVKLLYCSDRDVANDARIEIETHASSHLFTPALIQILQDKRHPNRRSAQWCVLDLFEDLPSFVASAQEEEEALVAIKELIWSAPDDYARTIYKAGVVLGGHLPHITGGKMLLSCLDAPSRIGRRSAIHGLFHTVEWVPDLKETVVRELRRVAEIDPEPLLRAFARDMARDIEDADTDHIQEPVFPDEA